MLSGFLLCLGLLTPQAPEAPVALAHWPLDTGLESTSGAPPLTVEPAESVTIVTEGDPRLSGRPFVRLDGAASVMVPTGLISGGPGFIGSWTLIIDLRLPLGRAQVIGLLQTDADDDDPAEIHLHTERGLGFERRYHGGIQRGRWHRVALVVDRPRGRAEVFVDGVALVHAERPIGDSRYALEPTLRLLADKHLKGGAIDLAGLHVRTEALSEGAIAALGGPADAPLDPLIAPPSLRGWTLHDPEGVPLPEGAALRRCARYPLMWTYDRAAGEVALITVAETRGTRREPQRLGALPMSGGHGVLTIPCDLDGDRVTLRLEPTAVGGPLTRDFALAGPRREYPQDLEVERIDNGDFLRALDTTRGEPRQRPARSNLPPAGWHLDGRATLRKISGRYHLSGLRGDYIASQRVPLPPELRDLPLHLAIGADLRRGQRPGRYDDLGFIEALFIDARGATLGSVRTLQADGQGWHRREAVGPVPAGTEVIEVRVVAEHRRTDMNSIRAADVSARLLPSPHLAATGLRKLPVLFAGDRPDRHRLVLETVGPALSPVVRFGAEGEEPKEARLEGLSVDGDHQIWRADLAPLRPDTIYTYSVETGGERAGPWSFRSPAIDDEAPLRVAWLADNQYGWETFTALLPKIKAEDPALIILAGDIVQYGDQRREWQTEWFTPLTTQAVGQTTPIQFARGNHDGEHALSYAYTWIPGNGAYFATTRGGVRFIFLDTEASPAEVPEQTRWLAAELASEASQKARFRVAVLHKPPYANRWDSPTARYDGEPAVRKHFVPIFRAHGVDLVVGGHAHAYQRRDFQGVRYVVIGGGGGRLDRHQSARWPMTVDWVGYHYAILDISPEKLVWHAKSLEGETIDTFELSPRSSR